MRELGNSLSGTAHRFYAKSHDGGRSISIDDETYAAILTAQRKK